MGSNSKLLEYYKYSTLKGLLKENIRKITLQGWVLQDGLMK
jgi:hypothetical protein